MNSPSCITPSSAFRTPGRAFSHALAAANGIALTGVAGFLLAACGGSHPPAEPSRPSEAAASPAEEKGAGVVTFRYSNRSADANLQVDLGATEVYLEMTGKPAEAAQAAPVPPAESPRKSAAPKPRLRPQPEATPEEDSVAESGEPKAEAHKRGTSSRPKTPDPKPKEDQGLRDEEGADGAEAPQDVTDKVLLGIRKAQEFFYQRRYPEALDMVRQSLNARPTAEGHALAGSIHYMMGATGLARRHWQQALRLNPDMPAVVNMLDKIATPGGRGSPNPRPLATRRKAPPPTPSVLEAASPISEAPFPEAYDEASAPAAPSTPAAPTPAPTPPPAPVPAPVPAPPAEASEGTAAPDTAPDPEPSAAMAPASAPSAPAAAAPDAAPAPAPGPAPAVPAAAPAKTVPGPVQAGGDASQPVPGGKPKFPRKEKKP